MSKVILSNEALKEVINVAKTGAIHGVVTPELKLLQDVCYRNKVNWLDWPDWSRPSNCEDYSCHEG